MQFEKFQSSPVQVGRALAAKEGDATGFKWFQSSPVQVGRALVMSAQKYAEVIEFQSSPVQVGRALGPLKKESVSNKLIHRFREPVRNKALTGQYPLPNLPRRLIFKHREYPLLLAPAPGSRNSHNQRLFIIKHCPGRTVLLNPLFPRFGQTVEPKIIQLKFYLLQ